jgi:carbonic anhydrase
VRESDNALRQSWGRDAPSYPGYREALIDMAVCLNAAHTAFSLRQQLEGAGNWDIEVLYGAYDVRTHQVCMPLHPDEPPDDPDPEHVNLVPAPSHPREFMALAAELAEVLRRPGPGKPDAPPPPAAGGPGAPEGAQ